MLSSIFVIALFQESDVENNSLKLLKSRWKRQHHFVKIEILGQIKRQEEKLFNWNLNMMGKN